MVVNTHKRSARSKRSSKKSKSHSGNKTMKNRKVMRGGGGPGYRMRMSARAYAAKIAANRKRTKAISEEFARRHISRPQIEPQYVPGPIKPQYVPGPIKPQYGLPKH